jgi:hypothetical protein
MFIYWTKDINKTKKNKEAVLDVNKDASQEEKTELAEFGKNS